MNIRVTLGALKQMRLKELALRFGFGGAITAAAGIIAMKFGPVIGGLFLAFPAILPASLTLVENHEVQKKAQKACAAVAADDRLLPRMRQGRYSEVSDWSCLDSSSGSSLRIMPPG
jgi:uncharacterized protein DUF3147